MDLAGKRVVVMGLGRFGGGLGATRYLAGKGARVLVTDLSPEDKLREPLQEIAPLIASGAVSLRLGEHREADFTSADLVVANPAVPKPWDNPYLAAARAKGVAITTEIGLTLRALLARFGNERTIGITGTVGKSTTTALIAHILRHAPAADKGAPRTVMVGGNLGGSLLEELDRTDPATKPWFVLELSSFMLHWLYEDRAVLGPLAGGSGGAGGVGGAGTAQGWSPRVAVVTNIAANHLDWHGPMDHYAGSKQHLIRFQGPECFAVLGSSVADWAGLTRAQVMLSDDQPWRGRMGLPGAHNRVNAFQAVAAAGCVRPAIPLSAVSDAVASFAGLPHRLERVTGLTPDASDQAAGPLAFNDSKSTTPEATLTAVAALAEEGGPGRVHLIAGGYDKGSDLSPIALLATGSASLGPIAGLYTIGKTGPTIAARARDAGAREGVVLECGTVEAAVDAAWARMKPGDALLLSPGCASWDQFTNYEARGDAFKAALRRKAGRA
jgi:UDP-N-acetylmuramoylalanine--D-glutamate ligase